MRSPFVKEYLNIEASFKQEALAVVFVAVSTLVLVLAKASFAGTIEPALASAVMVVASIFWMCTVSLSLLFQQERLALYTYSALILLAFLLFFSGTLVIIASVLLGLGLWEANRRAQDEKRLLVEFKPFRILRRALPTFLLTLAIFSAVAYVNVALSDDFNGEVRVPRPIFNVLYAPVEAALETISPSFDENFTVSQTQAALARDLFSEAALERLGLNNLFDNIEEGSEQGVPLKESIYSSLNGSIANAAAPYRELLPFVAMVGFFFAFRLLFFLLMWLSLGISVLAVKLLMLYNIVSIEETSVQQEHARLV